jgi:hypothetical protein
VFFDPGPGRFSRRTLCGPTGLRLESPRTALATVLGLGYSNPGTEWAERLFNRNRTVAIGIKASVGARAPTDRNGAMRAEAVAVGTCRMS